MVIFNNIDDINITPSSVLTIGTFDGVHRGHQEIISQTVKEAKLLNCPSVLITFSPHPQHILKTSQIPIKEIITPLEKKIRLIQQLGIDFLILLPFNIQMAAKSAEDFFNNIILNKFNPVKIVIGYDHHFGHKREGNDKFLAAKSKKHSFELKVIPPVCDGDITISSTAVRKAVSRHDLELANRILGHNFEISGIVIQGKGRGKRLTFPTANLHIFDKTVLRPPVGVYCVKVSIGNKLYSGACNIGFRPTFNEFRTSPLIEVNIFDSSAKDLYGRIITVQFLKFVREEIKFESPDQLVKQLIFDKEFCLNLHDK